MKDAEAKCKAIIQSNRITNRRQIDYNSANERQKNAHDVIIKALNLKENESKTDGGSNTSRLQLLIRKDRTGKLHILDSVITALIDGNDHLGNFL